MKFEVKNLPERQFLTLGKKIFKIFQEIEKKNYAVDLLFVGSKKMQQLNLTYRKKNKDTDVLSFPLQVVQNKKLFLGDIVFSKNELLKQGKEEGLNFVFSKLFIHGLYHLLGYTHEREDDYKKMLKKEKFLMKKVLDGRS